MLKIKLLLPDILSRDNVDFYQIHAFGISCSKILGKNGLFKKFLNLKDQDRLPKPWRYITSAVGAPKFSSGPGVGFRVESTPPRVKSALTSVWVGTKQLGSANQITFGNAVATDNSGNVYVAGSTKGGLDGNALTGALDGYSMTGTVDSFFSKYNSAGVKQFTRLLGVAGKETRGYGVATDANGNVFVAGYTEGSLDGNTLSGSRDFFITTYDNNRAKQFTRQLGAVGAVTVGNEVATDSIGDIFVTGSTTGGLDGNKQTGIHDFFVTKFAPDGVKK